MEKNAKDVTLVILSYIDYPYPIGLSKRIEGIVKVLSDIQNVNIKVYSPKLLRGKHSIFERVNTYQGKNVTIVQVPLPLRLPYRGVLKVVASLLTSLIVSSFALLHLAASSGRRHDRKLLIQYEHVVLAPFAYILKRFLNAYAIADDINILWIRFKSKLVKRLLFLYEYISLKKLSDYVLSASQYTYAFSKTVGIRFLHVPNIVIQKKVVKCEDKKNLFVKADKVHAVFVGNMTFGQNIKALHYIKYALDLMRAKYTRQYNKLVVHVIGGPLDAIPNSILNSIHVAERHFIFHGIVSETEKYNIYKSAQIALLPFFSSQRRWGGPMTKTIELLSNCMIVIAGPEAVRGLSLIPGRHYLQVRTPDEMAEQLASTIDNLESKYSIAIEAFNAIRRINSYDEVKRAYSELFLKLR